MITYCPPPPPNPLAELQCLTFPSLDRFSRWAQQNNITIPCWRWPLEKE
jgi:hypothetical protein